MTDRHGVSLVEVMIVVTIGVMIMLPTLSFLTMSQKTAYKGMDRLETLAAARLIMEQIQRDLKSSCEAGVNGFVAKTQGGKVTYEFPAFPNGPGADVLSPTINPANRITYVYDPARKELSRDIAFHPVLGLSRARMTRVMASNVASFTILPTVFLGMPVYEIDILCVPTHQSRQAAKTHLRSSVRSEHGVRQARHRWFLNNRSTRIDVR